jgi:hypothetical protein
MIRIRRAAEVIYFVGFSTVVTLSGLSKALYDMVADIWEGG